MKYNDLNFGRGKDEIIGSAANGNYSVLWYAALMLALLAQYDDFLRQNTKKHANL